LGGGGKGEDESGKEGKAERGEGKKEGGKRGRKKPETIFFGFCLGSFLSPCFRDKRKRSVWGEGKKEKGGRVGKGINQRES